VIDSVLHTDFLSELLELEFFYKSKYPKKKNAKVPKLQVIGLMLVEKIGKKIEQKLLRGLQMQWQTNGVTYSEAWRRECEARDLLSKPLHERRRHLALVEEKRGLQALYYLQEEMLRLWNIQKKQQQGQESSSLPKAESMAKQNQIELI
jgi:hypothetical protein